MGEDLFWAIRGGGALSFGVIVAWKLNLVDVPETVTVFATTETLEQNATSIFHKWQSFVPNADRYLFLRAQLTTTNSATSGKKTVLITLDAVFLGGIDRLIPLMDKDFPELGLTREVCTELTWAADSSDGQGLPRTRLDKRSLHRTDLGSICARDFRLSSQVSQQTLLNRSATADFVQKPISVKGIEGMWRLFLKADVRTPNFILSPYGGRMNEISASTIPFPHRAGDLYVLLECINWLQSVYSYLGRYVSKSPRSADMNYHDRNLGVRGRTESYAAASNWGTKLFW